MTTINDSFRQAKSVSGTLSLLSDEIRNQVLCDLSLRISSSTEQIIIANHKDLALMEKTDPRYDRLLLNEDRINAIARDLCRVAELASPLGKILEHRVLVNGLDLTKVSVPLGVVAVIYEARPNVTIDVFSLCFKSGNAVVLKGGKEAEHSNRILVQLIHETLAKFKLSPDMVFLMPADRSAVHDLLNAVGFIDVCIPRGSQGLIDFVRENAKIPVIETGAGIVHNYFDLSGDIELAAKVINNAKTRRVSVCNALDTLLIHRKRLTDLPLLVAKLSEKQVVIYADRDSFNILQECYPAELLKPANEESYGQEFLDYKLAIKTVADIDEALAHIQRYSSGHSEAILANDPLVIEKFINQIDAAAVYVNASTAFTDGGEFGLGAEIGISTQKLHARGPMGLSELTSYKWIVRGSGQIR